VSGRRGHISSARSMLLEEEHSRYSFYKRKRRLPEERGAPETSSEGRPESSSESEPKSSSESEAEDDLVVILEDHTDVMPPHLLALESRPAYRYPLLVAKPLSVACRNCHNLQETASIEPELTQLDGLDGSENADRGSQWSQEFDGLEAQAMQKKTAISNLCNDRIYWRPQGWRGSTKAFTRGVLRAAEKLISKNLIRSSHGKLKFDDNLLSLRSILQSWKEDQAHVVARALRDACDAMFKENMSVSRLQTLIWRYDKIIALLTKNV